MKQINYDPSLFYKSSVFKKNLAKFDTRLEETILSYKKYFLKSRLNLYHFQTWFAT